MASVSNLDDYRGKPEAGSGSAGLKGGGGGGTFDDMEARVRILERAVDKIDVKLDVVSADIKSIAAKLDKLIPDVAEMKGRVSAMPTTWQIIGLVLGIMGATFAVLRFGAGKL